MLAMLLSTGAGEGQHAATFLGLSYGVWQALNLVVFVFLLVHFLRKPMREYFAQRRADVNAALKKAQDDRGRAEAIAEELAQRLAKIEAELADVRAQAGAQAIEEEAEIQKRAGEEAARIVARTLAEMDSRVKTARAELTAYAADLAVELAREILKRTVTPEDGARLFREGVESLAGRSGR